MMAFLVSAEMRSGASAKLAGAKSVAALPAAAAAAAKRGARRAQRPSSERPSGPAPVRAARAAPGGVSLFLARHLGTHTSGPWLAWRSCEVCKDRGEAGCCPVG